MDDQRVSPRFVRALNLADLLEGQSRAVNLEGNLIALFNSGGRVFAVDNRCPHMGFPLDRGSVKDCILTCHWHHARFDLATGGTFDQWADDVRAFPVRVEKGVIWIDLAEQGNFRERQTQRLGDGLERNLSLVIAKSVIALLERGEADPVVPFRKGLDFGARNRREGWGSGLTTLTCMMNLVPWLDPADRSRALYQGLASVAEDCVGNPPHFTIRSLPGAGGELEKLKRWLRQFVEVRDAEGAERCVTSAVRAGASQSDLAAMMFAAATDHRYLTTGHVLDFTNKAFEALDHAGWDRAEVVLASLARSYADGERMEESNQWRHPVDLIAILDRAFEAMAPAIESGRGARRPWIGAGALVSIILGDDPEAIAEAMLTALREGCTPDELGGAVAYAAAMRIARFHTSNEFGDWDTAHHSFTFSNAVHQGLRRAPSVELLRGAFDGAMSVYLNRFLNIPAARIPHPNGSSRPPQQVLAELPGLFDRQQQVNEAGTLIAEHFATHGDDRALIAALGHALLREDRDFHSIQGLEAAVRQYAYLGRGEAGANVLIATARYLAAHAPTPRAQGQTFRIAERLFRGDRLFEGE
ncbi:MAG TPA: Rieske (2Fe-2S) protein [Candidatus Binataceae bacterium]|nr:Rieske (2Fe-2S) protein [Candidatus Binataceae bacterium]